MASVDQFSPSDQVGSSVDCLVALAGEPGDLGDWDRGRHVVRDLVRPTGAGRAEQEKDEVAHRAGAPRQVGGQDPGRLVTWPLSDREP